MPSTSTLNLTLIDKEHLNLERFANFVINLAGNNAGTDVDPLSTLQKLDEFAGQIYTDLDGIYTKDEVDSIIESLARIDIRIVHSIDDVTEAGHIYLIPIEDLEPEAEEESPAELSEVTEASPAEEESPSEGESSSDNIYIEYIYINGHGPERIGSTDIDLSKVYTRDETDALLDAKQDLIDENNKLDYALLKNIPSVPLNDVYVVASFSELQSEGYIEEHLSEILQCYKIHILSQRSTFYRHGEPTPQVGSILLDGTVGARLSTNYLYISDGESNRTFILIDSNTYAVTIDQRKQLGDKLTLTNQTISTWQDYDNDTYSYVGYVYHPDISSSTVLEVFFSLDQAVSQDYAPVCETSSGKVAIYSKTDDEITIPLIKEL